MRKLTVWEQMKFCSVWALGLKSSLSFLCVDTAQTSPVKPLHRRESLDISCMLHIPWRKKEWGTDLSVLGPWRRRWPLSSDRTWSNWHWVHYGRYMPASDATMFCENTCNLGVLLGRKKWQSLNLKCLRSGTPRSYVLPSGWTTVWCREELVETFLKSKGFIQLNIHDENVTWGNILVQTLGCKPLLSHQFSVLHLAFSK